MRYGFLVLDTMEGKMDDAWPASNASLCPVPSSTRRPMGAETQDS